MSNKIPCPECTSTKITRFRSQDEKFLLCKACGCMFLPNGEVVPDEKEQELRQKRIKVGSGAIPWFMINYFTGYLLVVLLGISVLGIWMPMDFTLGSEDVESAFNYARICGTAILLDALFFILSTIKILRGVENS